MTHVVIMYVLMVMMPSGNPYQHTYPSYNSCMIAKEHWVDLGRKSHQKVVATCTPEQRSEEVEK
jgi:hypothetical protein